MVSWGNIVSRISHWDHCQILLLILSEFPEFPADLATFTEEIRNGKLHYCAVYVQQKNYGGIKNLGLERHGIYDVIDFSGFKQKALRMLEFRQMQPWN